MNKIKNIGIFAHVDAGKTTITEQLLYRAGAIKEAGRVDKGSTTTDSDSIERERGISIYSMPTSYCYDDVKVNIIDTPGHVDFVAEVERSMHVLDGALLVLSAKEGVQSHSKLLYRALKRLKVPTLIVINKIDRLGVKIDSVLSDIKRELDDAVVCLQDLTEVNGHFELGGFQITENMIEKLAFYDESLLDKYIEGKLEKGEIIELIRQLTKERSLIPICYASALKGIGIEVILEYINIILPNYEQKSGQVSGVVFKVFRKGATKNTCIKLVSGHLELHDYIDEDKITGIKVWENGRLVKKEYLSSGEIAIVRGLHHKKIGDTFGDYNSQVIQLSQPTLKTKLSFDKLSERSKLLEVLSTIKEQDPYLSYELSDFNLDIYVNLFGFVQMDILQESLRRDHDVHVKFEKPKTILKETPLKRAQATVELWDPRYPFAAGVTISVEPLEQGAGLELTSNVTYGHLQKMYQNAVFDGIKYHVKQGLYGWELTDIRITLEDFTYNSVSSTPKDYRGISPIVLFQALKEAGSKLLWPINAYKCQVQTEQMGKVLTDIQIMKGTFSDPIIDEDQCQIEGFIPAKTSIDYEQVIHEITSGYGYFESKLSHYESTNIKERRENFILDPANEKEYLMGKMRVM